jgi:AcrR family transcriptional regulator
MTSPSTETRIWQESIRLFARQGFAGTSTRDIAEAVGLTAGSLYHYMGSKSNLLEQIMFGAMTGLNDAATEIVETVTSPLLAVATLVEFHVVTHCTFPLESRVVDREIEQLGAESRAKVLALRDAYEARWTTAIDDGVAAGELQVADARLATRAVLGMCTEVATWFRPSGSLTPEHVSREFAAMALSMLGANAAAGSPVRADIEALELARFVALFERRGGYGMTGVRASSRRGA